MGGFIAAATAFAAKAAPIVKGIGAVASTVSTVSGLFKKGPSAPSPAPLPKPPSTEAAEAKAKKEIDDKRRAVARNKTRYTGPLGLTSLQKQSDITKKVLLGT